MQGFGKRIVFLRVRQGLTQSDFARNLGISRAALSHYEKGRRVPSYDVVLNMAESLGMSVDYLIGRNAAGAGKERLSPEMLESLELSSLEKREALELTVDGARLTESEVMGAINYIRMYRVYC